MQRQNIPLRMVLAALLISASPLFSRASSLVNASPQVRSPVFAFSFPSKLKDTLSRMDMMKIKVSFSTQSSRIKTLSWWVDGDNIPLYRVPMNPPRAAGSAVLRHQWADEGIHTVYAVLEDIKGRVFKDSAKVVVIEDPPSAFAGKDTSVKIISLVRLKGVSKDRFGTIVQREWKCGEDDFTTVSGNYFSLTVPSEEQDGFSCIFQVTDDDGNSSADTVMLSLRKSVNLEWEQVGGNGIRNSWDAATPVFPEVRVMVEFQGKLYAGLHSSEMFLQGSVWAFDGQSWEQVGGGGVNGSWPNGEVMVVSALAVSGDFLYAGTGLRPGMAKVWRFDGKTWEKIGGDGMNGGWGSEGDCVWNLNTHDGILIAGLVHDDMNASYAPLYKFENGRWELLTGVNHENGGWGVGDGYFMSYATLSEGPNLYVGLAGRLPGTGDLFHYDGTNFTQIGGDGIMGSWSNPNIHFFEDAMIFDHQMHVTVDGTLTGTRRDPPVWRSDESGWHPVGDVPMAWDNPDFWVYDKLHSFQDELYLAGGGMAPFASMWKLTKEGRWIKAGGDGLFGSQWNTGSDQGYTLWIYTICEFQGELYVGLASADKDGMGQVWRMHSTP